MRLVMGLPCFAICVLILRYETGSLSHVGCGGTERGAGGGSGERVGESGVGEADFFSMPAKSSSEAERAFPHASGPVYMS